MVSTDGEGGMKYDQTVWESIYEQGMMLEEMVLEHDGYGDELLPYPPDPWEVEELANAPREVLVVNEPRLWHPYFRYCGVPELVWFCMALLDHPRFGRVALWAVDQVVTSE